MTQAKMRLFGCPEHQRDPTRASEAFKVERREKDEVYQCSWDCSWLYSMKLGLLRPHGIDVREVQESLETAYHMKQYRPGQVDADIPAVPSV